MKRNIYRILSSATLARSLRRSQEKLKSEPTLDTGGVDTDENALSKAWEYPENGVS